MNVEEYIASGILEAYVLGELSESERKEVERNLEAYPALQLERNRIEEIQQTLLTRFEVPPAPEVKASLFRTIDKERRPAKVIPINGKGNTTRWQFMSAASIAVAIVSSFLAFHYKSKLNSTEKNLDELITKNQQFAQDYNQVNERLDKIENDVRVINNPEFKRIIMQGTENAPGSVAYVYWNESSREVYLSIQEMKQLSQENQYQLWALIDGQPVDAGVFDADLTGLIRMKDMIPGAGVFAVTIEPRGGKSTPSLETLQVIGNVVRG